jgi:hypothetical protein
MTHSQLAPRTLLSLLSRILAPLLTLGLTAASLALVACGGGSAEGGSSQTVASSEPAPGAVWEGLWQTNFGPIGFAMVEGEPSLIAGAYEYAMDGRTISGTLLGTVQGNTLDVTWEDEPGGLGSGHARFTLSADGQSFTGTWGRGDSYTDGGEWSGSR